MSPLKFKLLQRITKEDIQCVSRDQIRAADEIKLIYYLEIITLETEKNRFTKFVENSSEKILTDETFEAILRARSMKKFEKAVNLLPHKVKIELGYVKKKCRFPTKTTKSIKAISTPMGNGSK